MTTACDSCANRPMCLERGWCAFSERVPSEMAATCECHGPAGTVARLMEDAVTIARMEDQGASAAFDKVSASGDMTGVSQTEARPTQAGETPRDCAHGQLARSCRICELERENAALQARLDAPVPEVEAVDKAVGYVPDGDLHLTNPSMAYRDLAHDLARRLAEVQDEKERFLAIGRQFETDSRKHFSQSCINLTRAQSADRDLALAKLVIEQKKDQIESAERALAEARIEHEAYCLRIAEQHDAQLAEARANERERWDLYCLRRAAEYCYDVPVECNTPETQDARDRTRAAIHKRILELLGERSALTDEAKP